MKSSELIEKIAEALYNYDAVEFGPEKNRRQWKDCWENTHRIYTERALVAVELCKTFLPHVKV